jgi:predicted DNA-binding transcriptional regulator YafY
VGHDLVRDAPRAFRVDRIEGEPALGPPRSFDHPAGLDVAQFVRDDPLTYGEDRPIDARVLVDASRAGWVVEQLGEEAVAERRRAGSVVVELSVVNRAAFRSWVLDLLDHAEVLGPDELRDDLVSWLDTIVETPR